MLCGGFSAEVRAKKMRQETQAEFISASFSLPRLTGKGDREAVEGHRKRLLHEDNFVFVQQPQLPKYRRL